MSNSGKELEDLVRNIERCLSPGHFDIKLNKRVFNDDGVQMAEFDLVISGEVGSSSVNWLIECRDRPSQGSAPGSWIEQLVGRRSRFKFDKVFAVSTTGFATDAKDYAKSQGIILRNVLSVDEIADDFKTIKFRYQNRKIKLNGFLNGDISSKNLEIAKEILSSKRIEKIKLPEEDEYYCVEQLILKQLAFQNNIPQVENDSAFDRIFKYKGNICVYVDNERYFQMRNLEIPYQLILTHYFTETIAGKVYSEESRVIGQEIGFHYDTPEGIHRVTALLITKPDGTVEARELKHVYAF